MFSFLRHAPSRLGSHEPLQRTSGGTAVLPDVRETPERRSGHAPGALHLLPLPRLLTGASLSPVARGGPVVTVCRSGHHIPPVTGEGGPGGVIP
ncbi:rhodanese-like domain-containing protein [Streptomyces sp. NEAU-H22]|uniref:rhodanese-like domain-containing protein n=1 Tax=Streptomyces sp. NEAU-H22 TaxID=2994655 RepID=UPI002B1CCCFC|nr:rhodanese-like domain-containing protein [Streptomyces sp. NEAU-H22]